jgi:hypothetical protein
MGKFYWLSAFIMVFGLIAVLIYKNPVSLTVGDTGAVATSGDHVWQMRDGQVRRCHEVEQYGSVRKVNCSEWSKN